ncbi:MAG: hypothetical protein PWQ35_63 [Patescibacteria group bacterium]|nr:hypothetical protein [Patescibacteria group bacterium]
MPRTKKNESESDSKKKTASKKAAKTKTISAKKVKSTKSEKKSASKKTGKVKPVIVDVINDEDLEESTFFSDDALGADELDFQKAQDFFLDLEEGEVPRVDQTADIEVSESKEDFKTAEETDKQKQFFSDLVTEIKQRKESGQDEQREAAEKTYKNKKSIRLYRSLAWKFLILVGLLAAFVFYFSFSKLTILITPKVEAMNDTLYLKIANTEEEVRPGDARDQVSGSVNELSLEVEKEYAATGEEFVGEEIIGKVRIINNYSRNQALVASTRLLSPDNKLFRIKEAVNVPAGGEVTVDIYADTVSREMAIAPTRFIIPGLWVGLQDSIYAISDEAFSYQQKMEKYVKASDIQLAKSEAYDLLLEKAKSLKTLRGQDEVLYEINTPIDIEINAAAGDKVDSFLAKAQAKVLVVSFAKDEVEQLVASKLKVLVPDDRELVEFNPDSLSYTLESYDIEEGLATIKANFSSFMILNSDADVIDKEKLVNLTAEQIRTYLKDYPEISDYDLKFYPSFIKKAPRLVDRIEIKIKK